MDPPSRIWGMAIGRRAEPQYKQGTIVVCRSQAMRVARSTRSPRLCFSRVSGQATGAVGGKLAQVASYYSGLIIGPMMQAKKAVVPLRCD